MDEGTLDWIPGNDSWDTTGTLISLGWGPPATLRRMNAGRLLLRPLALRYSARLVSLGQGWRWRGGGTILPAPTPGPP